MTRSFRRMWACAVVLFTVAGGAFAQPPDAPPDQETLRRLARQLGAGQQTQITPEMIEWAKEFTKNNPELVKKLLKNNPGLENSPAVQQQIAEMKQKAQQDPNYLNDLKRQWNLTQDQVQQFKEQWPNAANNPGGNGPGGHGSGPPPENRVPPPPPPVGPPPDHGQAPAKTPDKPFDNIPGNTKLQNQNQFPPQQPGSPGGHSWDPNAAKNLAENNKDFAQVANFWEANVGPLDNTPALKQSLVEMFSGSGKSPFDGMGSGNGTNNPFGGMNGGGQGGGQSWWNSSGSGPSSSGFSQWFNNMTSSGGPSWWKSLTGGGSGKSWFSGAGGPSTMPSMGNGFGGGGSGFSGDLGIGSGGITGLGTVGTVLLFVILAAVVGYIVYRYWPQIQAMRTKPKAIPGLGEWPLDPRDVRDRETLVRAFEYFSVFLCGDSARVWNHVTIAEAFRENVPASIPFADHLARLYAVARYTPAREEIAASDIAAARRYLCQLAGVSEA